MRHLEILRCPESWDRMAPNGDGRFCARCALRVSDVAKLDEAGIECLVDTSASERVCVRLEANGGRPRTSLGLAAGLLVVALGGCATSVDGSLTQAPTLPSAALFDGESSGAIIAGQVREPSGAAAVNALVVLQSVALAGEQPEVLTDERGVYHFDNLPPGNYTITVVHAEADVAKVMHVPADARLRANFAINPKRDTEIIVGMLIERPMIDTTSASSSYSSTLTEYD